MLPEALLAASLQTWLEALVHRHVRVMAGNVGGHLVYTAALGLGTEGEGQREAVLHTLRLGMANSLLTGLVNN